MKETITQIRAGAMWVLFVGIALPMLKKIIELAEESQKEAVAAGFTRHEFSGHMAALKEVEPAILRADYQHYKVTKRMEKKGVKMCDPKEFNKIYLQEKSAQEKDMLTRASGGLGGIGR